MDNPASLLKFIKGVIEHDVFKLGISGVAGAVVAAVAEWRGAAVFFQKIIVGGISAMFVSDLIVPLLGWFMEGINLPRERAVYLSAFIVGMCGIAMVDFFQHMFRSYVTKQKDKGK